MNKIALMRWDELDDPRSGCQVEHVDAIELCDDSPIAVDADVLAQVDVPRHGELEELLTRG